MKEKLNNLIINPFIFYTFLVIYLELINKIFILKNFINVGLIYTTIFIIPIILILTTLTKMFNNKLNKIIMFTITTLIVVYYEVQLIFFNLFSIPFSFSTLGLANQALDFTNIIKDAILGSFPLFIALFLPLIILIIFHKKIDLNKYNKYTLISLLSMCIITYLSTFITLLPNKKEYNSSYKLYYNVDAPESIINRFGLLTYLKIDISRQIFGFKAELILNNNVETTPEEITFWKNELELDLTIPSDNETINQLNNYFNNTSGTYKNEYTGMFKDKNLIFILAEGFNEIAVDENRTPTLYKLIHSGFDFTNFYSPEFLSTTGGEFQATTGLLPTQEILNIWKNDLPQLPYAIGNAFSGLGYRAQAYHNWTYSYYKRQYTMPSLGFQNYIGCKNGLEQEMNCGWLTKDTDMINVTTPKYLNQEGNFVTYYITLSGHAEYSQYHNVAKVHMDTVNDLPYSDIVKYYLASQVELDKMLELLIQRLEESGELKDTVIALVGDHYPYTLSTEEINEVSKYEKDGTIEVNHSNFIIWNSEMKKPIVIDKVGSQIDVLPTLLNLFGIDYDSRLIVGKDILSDNEGLAIFSNFSWVTDYGTYYSQANKFVLKDGKKLENEAEYINRINQQVSNSFSISKMIMETNYYNYIVKK